MKLSQCEISKKGIDHLVSEYSPGKVEEEKETEVVGDLPQDARLCRNSRRFYLLTKKAGFDSPLLYIAHLASYAGATGIGDFISAAARKTDFSSPVAYVNDLLEQSGFDDWDEYERHLTEKYQVEYFSPLADLYLRVVVDKEFD